MGDLQHLYVQVPGVWHQEPDRVLQVISMITMYYHMLDIKHYMLYYWLFYYINNTLLLVVALLLVVLFICMYVYVYIYIYIYTHTATSASRTSTAPTPTPGYPAAQNLSSAPHSCRQAILCSPVSCGVFLPVGKVLRSGVGMTFLAPRFSGPSRSSSPPSTTS